MSGHSNLPITLIVSSITGQREVNTTYNIVPLSIVESMFEVIIVGYKVDGSSKKVVATNTINNNEKEVLIFLNENNTSETPNTLDGYFIIYEPDKSKQKQILEQLCVGFNLPF